MMDELKPCPFCGSTNITMGAYSIAPECHIECECGARIELTVNFDDGMSVKEHDDLCAVELAKAWNRRVQQRSNEPLPPEEQLTETEAIAESEHCLYMETLGELYGMEARCQIVEKQLADVTAERDAAIADLNNIISMHQTCGLCGQSGYCMQDGKCNGWWYGLRKEKHDE